MKLGELFDGGGGFDFRARHAAGEMARHVLRLGRRRVIHIAAEVEVPVVGVLDFCEGHAAGVFLLLNAMLENVDDLLDVLGPELVLLLALGELAVGIDEEDVVALLVGDGLVQDDDDRRDAGAVKQFGRQPDDGFDDPRPQQRHANLALLPPAKQNAVRHDHRAAARALQTRQHVLEEHEVRLLPRLRRVAMLKSLRTLAAGERPVLREGRIGNDAIGLEELAVLHIVWLLQHVAELDV